MVEGENWLLWVAFRLPCVYCGMCVDECKKEKCKRILQESCKSWRGQWDMALRSGYRWQESVVAGTLAKTD